MRPINVDKLQCAMQARALTQRALANKAGLAESVVWNAVHGGHIRPSTVQALAKALVEAAS